MINMLRLLVLLFIITIAPVAGASTETVGKTVAVVGRVLAQHQGEDRQHPLQVRQPVFLYDVLESGVGSRAKFMMKDDSILKLGPNSEIILDELMVGADQQKSTVKQLKGHLRILLGKKLKPKSHFKVQTPVAVAGVRGTDFEVIIGEGGITAVRCFEGEVEVKNLLDSIPGQVILVPNVYTIVEEGKPPTVPAPIPAGQPLQAVLGDRAASNDAEEDEKENGTVAESPDTEDTTEGGHSDPESEGEGSTAMVAGGASSTTTSSSSSSGAGTTASPTTNSGAGTSTSSGDSVSQSTAETYSTEGTAGSTSGVSSPGGALAGDFSRSADSGSGTGSEDLTGSGSTTAIEGSGSQPMQDTAFESLSVQEIQQVSSNNFSENSSAGRDVQEFLRVGEFALVDSTNTFISELTIDTVMDDVVEDSLGVGPEDTVPDPIADFGSINFDITFPTP